MRCANMEELNANCLGCMRCELGKTRTNLVFGVGNDRAEVMLIGEGPGCCVSHSCSILSLNLQELC